MGGRKVAAAQGRTDDALLAELRECLAQRCIEKGFRALRGNSELLEARSLKPGAGSGARLVGHLAQWIDVGAFDRSK